MTWARGKPPDEIRTAALELAVKKARDGCRACADAYLELARRHDATDDDINSALGAQPDAHSQP